MTQALTVPRVDPSAVPDQSKYLDPAFVKRNTELTLAFNDALVNDPELSARLPRGVTVVLLPEDAEREPEFVELSIALGLESIREGRDVLFQHMPGNAQSEPR